MLWKTIYPQFPWLLSFFRRVLPIAKTTDFHELSLLLLPSSLIGRLWRVILGAFCGLPSLGVHNVSLSRVRHKYLLFKDKMGGWSCKKNCKSEKNNLLFIDVSRSWGGEKESDVCIYKSAKVSFFYTTNNEKKSSLFFIYITPEFWPVWKTGKPGMRSSNTLVGLLTVHTNFIL